MSDYDPIDDVWKSVAFAYAVIRERMRNGGPGWTPKTLTLDGTHRQRREDEVATGGPDIAKSRSESFEGRRPTR